MQLYKYTIKLILVILTIGPAIVMSQDSADLKSANDFYKNKEYQKAIDKYNIYFQSDSEITEQYFEAKTNLASCYSKIKDFENQLNVYNDVINKSKSVPFKEIYYKAVQYKIQIARKTKKPIDVIPDINEMIAFAQTNGDSKTEFSGIEHLLHKYSNSDKEKYESALERLKKASKSVRQKRISSLYIANNFVHTNQDSARYYFEKALTLSRLENDSSAITGTLREYASFLSLNGDIDNSISSLIEALNYIQDNKMAAFKTMGIYSTISEAYKDLDNYIKAEEFILKAIAIAEKKSYSAREGHIARIYAEILFSTERYDESIIETEKALAHNIKRNYSKNILGCHLLLGDNYLAKQETDKAFQIYNDIEYSEKMNEFPVLMLRYYSLGARINLKRNAFTKSISAGKKALSISYDLDFDAEKIDLHLMMAKIYQASGQLVNSNNEFEKMALLREETYHQNLINATANYEAKYKKAEQDNIILSLDNENQIKQTKISQQRNLLTIGTIGMLIFALLSFFIYRLYKKLRKQNLIINESLEEKEILLKEIHHRVKNNLQVISSLLGLQSRQIDNKDIQKAINEGRNRVRSMALIHQNLYQSENLTGVNVLSYLQKLIEELFDTYNIEKDKVKLNLDIDNIDLDVDLMVPLGLIINELVSNALKHAFPNNASGEVLIKLKEMNNSLYLEVSDNGIGSDFNFEKTGKSFGNRLIRAFSNKLKAELSVTSVNGTNVSLSIMNYKKAS